MRDVSASLSLRDVVGRNASTLSCVLLVLAVLLGAALDRSLPAAVYLLSFWHYCLYWLAFAFGAAHFDVFKRNAVAMKTVSVVALAAGLSALLRSTPSPWPSSPAASC